MFGELVNEDIGSSKAYIKFIGILGGIKHKKIGNSVVYKGNNFTIISIHRPRISTEYWIKNEITGKEFIIGNMELFWNIGGCAKADYRHFTKRTITYGEIFQGII